MGWGGEGWLIIPRWKQKGKTNLKVETKQNKMKKKKIHKALQLIICVEKNLGKFIGIKTYLISKP